MSDVELDYWFVVMAADPEPIRGLIEGVIPAAYKPTSRAMWCMCKAETKERAIELAEESCSEDLKEGESLHLASVSRLCNTEAVS